ncbi:hypothetical protein TSAR_013628 [Trichomalopsis sarcophagae]|uniref:Secreted protein n=1 Tax=Trichomalopsis sarcophagae TaxID=543379 RepID=A0A232F840_9HYME|nr:hypothetical protein TSAR_013628 [Trichomalopsis sarcophagae]
MRVLLEDAAAAVAFLLLLGAEVHLAHDLREDLVDVGAVLGRRLDERAAPHLRQGITLRGVDLTLVLQVELVGHQKYRDPLGALDPGDQLLHGFDVLEGLVVRQTVDHHEALAIFNVEVSHAGKLLRASCVEDLQDTRRVVHLDLLPVEVLDCRVVLLHEAAGHKLHCQGTLAHTARA